MVSEHNDTGLRQSCIQLQPPAIEQLNHLIAIDSRHTRCRGMSQRALDLRMFQDVIASRPRDKIHACRKRVEPWLPHRRIAHRDELKRPLE